MKGQAPREASYVNWSLVALADILGALSECRGHVPYRTACSPACCRTLSVTGVPQYAPRPPGRQPLSPAPEGTGLLLATSCGSSWRSGLCCLFHTQRLGWSSLRRPE